MSRSGSSSSTGSTSVDVIESPSMLAGESCEYMFAPGNASCLVARSCQSCLQKSGCIIAGGGYCQDQLMGPAWGDDYRLASQYGLVLPNATESNATGIATQQAWSFPAFEAKYCAADDTTCTLCKQSNFWWSSWPDTRFCVGEDGCVCIMACEVADYSSYCVNTVTTTPTPTRFRVGDDARGGRSVVVYAIPVLLSLMFYLLCERIKRHKIAQEVQEHERRLNARREQREAALQQRFGVGRMNLTGWNKYRGDLIDKENLELSSTAPPFVAIPETPQAAEQRSPRADHRPV